jgi:hypothetical protein
MADTTSIDDLPTDPMMGGNQNNLSIQKMEMGNGGGMGGGGMGMPPPSQIQGQVYSPNIAGLGGQNQQQQQQQQQPYQQQQQQQQPNVINELVNGLQRASASGLTNLPSRDIPMNTMNMMSDTQVNPNFIPRPPPNQPQANYIEDHDNDEDVMDEIKKANLINTNDSMENIYRLIQVPLLVGILYFAFQLPITRKYILKYLPSVFNADGNFNVSGLVFMSALFGLGYFGLTKMLDKVESF